MSNPLAWVDPANPVAQWWLFLVGVSCLNIGLWVSTRRELASAPPDLRRTLVLLAGIYTFVCAFRGIMPRADVQRIVLFDTWFSSVFVGRLVATIAELSFVAQFALVIRQYGRLLESRMLSLLGSLVFPLIAVAEVFSWYSVVTTNYVGNTCEEFLWTLTFALVGLSSGIAATRTRALFRNLAWACTAGCALYVAFMLRVDVNMYWTRWHEDMAAHRQYLGFMEGIRDLNTRWVVTYRIEDWSTERAWMALYFSVAVWTSQLLCRLPLTEDQLDRHRH